MDVGHPYADVVPGARGAILATLARIERPMTIRELARQAQVSSGRATEIVAYLARAGLVLTNDGGRATFVRLNHDHLEAEGVLALVGIRAKLIARLEAEFKAWDEVSGAWLFGSAARGDGNWESDIDLLLVARRSIETDAWSECTSHISECVRRWTGNDVQLIEHTMDSFQELIARRTPLARAIRNEGIALTPGSQTVQDEIPLDE